MQVIAGMNTRLPLTEVGPYARRVEQLGYDALHVPEMVFDPYVAAALATAATTTLRIRTGVALAFVRSPMATALAAWGLAQQSQGRFDLGLGTQIRPNVERRYGADFDRPVGRMAATLAAVDACFDAFETGQAIDLDNGFYRLDLLQPEFRPDPLGATRRPELWLGAVGDQMVRLAGQRAHGLLTHPTNTYPADLDGRILPGLAAAAAEQGRPTPPVIGAPLIATGIDAAATQAALEPVRRRLAFLYSTPAYAPTLELLGFAPVGPELRALIRDDAWDRLGTVLPRELLHSVAPIAPWSELPGMLHERFGNLAGVVVRPPSTTENDQTLAAALSAIQSSR